MVIRERMAQKVPYTTVKDNTGKRQISRNAFTVGDVEDVPSLFALKASEWLFSKQQIARFDTFRIDYISFQRWK